MVFVFHEVPFPATSDQRSRVAGNGTECEVKIPLNCLHKPVEVTNELFLISSFHCSEENRDKIKKTSFD